jgi:tRNA pseudouridine55 synthase|tara:strand:- start:341 stop:1282 length:942 start_codon:yes stop_codon:yes gene_type:complete
MSFTLNSVVNLFKPIGPTSFDMVWSVRKALGVKKAGHIGTLDPMAEGVLPICLNRSTRIIQFLSPLQKTYRATLELGSSTDTQDATGQKISFGDSSLVTDSKVKQALQAFVGQQDQIPPMYSAKKKNGIPLYKLARNGINIPREPVKITVYSIDFIKKEGAQVFFEVRCSAGTYIRTLSHDIGERLGCCAHMVSLTRTQVGLFDLERTLTLEELKAANEDGSLCEKLFPLEEALNFLPAIRVKEEYLESISHGVALSKCSLDDLPDQLKMGHYFRVLGNNDKILAVVEAVVNQDSYTSLAPEDIVFKAKRVLC